ncbi:MAG: hypothetical protein JWP88_1063 [Flaviaesturariibacter sp.]|nr:hypothetical protein [Flaviaesturariibacter sp.]
MTFPKLVTSRRRCLYFDNMQPTNCPNCEATLQPAFDYCPACGQGTHLHRINGKHLAHELLHFFTHADKGIFLLIKELAVRPGVVAREYIAGRRKKYFNPLNFFFIVIGLFVLTITSFHTFQRPSNFSAQREGVQRISDITTRTRILAKLDRAEEATGFMERYANLVTIVVTPLVAFIFLLFYPRPYNFSEHLIANLYLAGFVGVVFIIVIAPMMSFLPGSYSLLGIGIYFLFMITYRSVAYYQFIGKEGTGAKWKAFTASFIGVVSWALLSQGAMMYYINHGFKI